MKISKNNKGFTLIEVIIGIAILGIIAGPLFMTFTSSMRTASRTQEISDAMVLAENIAEQLETADMDAVINSNEILEQTITEDDKIIKTKLNYGNFESGFENYQVIITLDTTSEYQEINEQAISQYTAIDLLLKQPEGDFNPDNKAEEKIIEEIIEEEEIYLEEGQAPPSIVPHERTIIVTIEENGDKLEANLEFEYRYKYGYRTKSYVDDNYSGMFSASSIDEEGEIPSLYFIYQPWAEVTAENEVKDRIEIVNEWGKPLNVFLVSNGEAKKAIEILLKEANFREPVTEIRSDLGGEYQITGLDSIGVLNTTVDIDDTVVIREEMDRIYSVSVDIYKSNADIDADEPIHNLTFTNLQ